MFVKPKAGLRVRDPETRDFLPTEGREVSQSLYWTRRVLCGDVVQVASMGLPASAVAASKERT